MPHAWALLLVYIATLVFAFFWKSTWAVGTEERFWVTGISYFQQKPLSSFARYLLMPLAMWLILWDNAVSWLTKAFAASGVEATIGTWALAGVAILLGLASDKISDVLLMLGKSLGNFLQRKITALLGNGNGGS